MQKILLIMSLLAVAFNVNCADNQPRRFNFQESSMFSRFGMHKISPQSCSEESAIDSLSFLTRGKLQNGYELSADSQDEDVYCFKKADSDSDSELVELFGSKQLDLEDDQATERDSLRGSSSNLQLMLPVIKHLIASRNNCSVVSSDSASRISSTSSHSTLDDNNAKDVQRKAFLPIGADLLPSTKKRRKESLVPVDIPVGLVVQRFVISSLMKDDAQVDITNVAGVKRTRS